MSDIEQWIALSLVPEVGIVTCRKLLSVFGKPRSIFKTSLKELSSIEGVGRKKAESLKGFSDWRRVEKDLKRLEQINARVITLMSPDYPELLKQTDQAPVLLYIKGKFREDDRFSIAVVGPRKPTTYGRLVAEKLSSELAESGFTVVSGMARGIDTISHRSSIRSGCRTIGVLGSGVDRPYPSENRDLMEKIADSGCVVSQFPVGTAPNRENFPIRNRTISGLSLGVLVVEATEDNGSLITAHCALEQNREVFAVPGNITSEYSAGTNELIKKGAKLVQGTDDILGELAPVLKGYIRSREKAKIVLTDEEKKLCDILTPEPRHIDAILRETSLSSAQALALPLSLELKGAVRQTDGMRFCLFT